MLEQDTKVKMKVLFAIFLCIILSGCSDDFDKFERKTFEIETNIDGNFYIIDEIEDKLNNIVTEYSDELTLNYAEYTFSNENECSAMFHYKYEYNVNEKLYAKTIDLYVDSNGKAYKAIYTDGRINRVSIYPGNSISDKKIDVLEIFKENENSFVSDNSYITVSLDWKGVDIRYFTKNPVDSVVSVVEKKHIE